MKFTNPIMTLCKCIMHVLSESTSAYIFFFFCCQEVVIRHNVPRPWPHLRRDSGHLRLSLQRQPPSPRGQTRLSFSISEVNKSGGRRSNCRPRTHTSAESSALDLFILPGQNTPDQPSIKRTPFADSAPIHPGNIEPSPKISGCHYNLIGHFTTTVHFLSIPMFDQAARLALLTSSPLP